MRRTLIVQYSVTESVEVEVKDYELTQSELSRLAKEKAEYISPIDVDCLNWDWEEEPLLKGSERLPPDDFWFESSAGLVAASRALFITKEFPLPKEFLFKFNWEDPKEFSEKTKQRINEFLSKDWQLMSTHKGYFRNYFACFKQIKGLKVLGESDPCSMGYLILNDKLVGVLMPAEVKEGTSSTDVFRFAEDAIV